MKTKYLIAAIAAVALIISGALIYSYFGQPIDSGSEAFLNLLDDQGYTTSLSAYPERIVSLAPSATEILFAVGAGDKLVGVTDYDNYPYDFAAWVQAGNMTSVGDFKEPNMEVVASLNPDLILVSGGIQEDSVGTLRELGYKVLVLNPTNIDGVLKNIELVGKATGKNAEATALVNDITSRIEAVASKIATATSKPKVYYEVWYDPTSLWSAGSDAWQNELIEKAGGVNLFADQQLDYFQSSSEAVIDRNPDVILLPASGMGFGEPFWESLDAVKARPGWNTINAIKNNNLYEVDSDIVQRAGPRVADAVEQLAALFHPGLFP